MSQNEGQIPARPGWGVDWSSDAVRRRVFGVGISLGAANVAIALGATLALVHGFGIDSGWGFIVTNTILVAALSATLAIGINNRLMYRFSSGQEFANFTAITSRQDTKWSVVWLLFVGGLPILISIPAFHYAGLPLEGTRACQVGAILVALLVWHPFMRRLRDPAAGPVPQIITTEQLHVRNKQDWAAFGAFFLAMAPVIGILVLVAVARP